MIAQRLLFGVLPQSRGGFLQPSRPLALTMQRIYISLPVVKQPLAFHSLHPTFTTWSGKGA